MKCRQMMNEGASATPSSWLLVLYALSKDLFILLKLFPVSHPGVIPWFLVATFQSSYHCHFIIQKRVAIWIKERQLNS
jgi:hypothetical protein